MSYRTAIIVAIAVVLSMFALSWWVGATIERAMTTGWELPLWFRILVGVSTFWNTFCPLLTILLSVLLAGIAALTERRRSRA